MSSFRKRIAGLRLVLVGSSRSPNFLFTPAGLHARAGRVFQSQRSAKSGPWWQSPRFVYTVKMSSLGGGLGSAALFAVVSNPAQVGSRPEDTDEKSHHLKNGKGFVNLWDSFRDFSAPAMGMRLLWYVPSLRLRGLGPNTTADEGSGENFQVQCAYQTQLHQPSQSIHQLSFRRGRRRS